MLSQENEPKKFNLWYFPNEFKKENNSVDLNIKEWSLFLEEKYQEEDLIKIMYRRDGFKGQDNELKVLQSKTSKPRQIAQKEKEFIQYLDYALELENYLKTHLFLTLGTKSPSLKTLQNKIECLQRQTSFWLNLEVDLQKSACIIS